MSVPPTKKPDDRLKMQAVRRGGRVDVISFRDEMVYQEPLKPPNTPQKEATAGRPHVCKG